MKDSKNYSIHLGLRRFGFLPHLLPFFVGEEKKTDDRHYRRRNFKIEIQVKNTASTQAMRKFLRKKK